MTKYIEKSDYDKYRRDNGCLWLGLIILAGLIFITGFIMLIATGTWFLIDKFIK